MNAQLTAGDIVHTLLQEKDLEMAALHAQRLQEKRQLEIKDAREKQWETMPREGDYIVFNGSDDIFQLVETLDYGSCLAWLNHATGIWIPFFPDMTYTCQYYDRQEERKEWIAEDVSLVGFLNDWVLFV